MEPDPPDDRSGNRPTFLEELSLPNWTSLTTPSDETLCCCGSQCAEHGSRNATLQSLEKDVRDAARVGQALLVRHETYIAESEAERARLNDKVSRLDAENRDLEARNAQLTAENSEFLDQLAEVNNTVKDSDAHIASLTATLQSAQKEMEKLNKLAVRTEHLESELLECEKEQAQLQATLTRSMEEERAAVQRWRSSQRKISELQEQMEDIEREAREERARHQEVVQRLERRHAAEREMLPQSTNEDEHPGRKNGEVVSSFVKEILRDNANMQLAMVELQDLVASYKEAELNQTMFEAEGFQIHDEPYQPQTLDEELSVDQNQHMPEVHVHHHYHAPSGVAKRPPRSRSQQSAKLKMRRPVLRSGRSTPAAMSSQSSQLQTTRHVSAASTSSSVSSVDGRISKHKRWSAQSAQSQASAISSGPSSPPSTSYCPSTIFEQDMRTDESRPTSPESHGVWSPMVGPIHRKMESGDSSFQPLSPLRLEISDRFHNHQMGAITTISERSYETLPQASASQDPVSPIRPKFVSTASPIRSPSPRRPLRREDSHTSLLSISGMDIHSTFPSPARGTRYETLNMPWTSRQNSTTTLNNTTASATRDGVIKECNLLDSSLRERLGFNPVASKSDRYAPIMDTFGKRVGGWLSSRWTTSATNASDKTIFDPTKGISTSSDISSYSTPKKTSNLRNLEDIREGCDTTPTAPMNVPAVTSDTESIRKNLSLSLSPTKASHRSTGVNQTGGLPPLPLGGGFLGFAKKPITRMVDETALKECLTEAEEQGNIATVSSS